MTAKSDDLIVRPVRTKADQKAFVDLPWKLYADDPSWRPPLKADVHHLIDGPATNPWFDHAEAAFWLAERGGEIVGRISAQVDRLVLQHMGEGTGQWGMFECVDDQTVADALFEVASNWLGAKRMTRMIGPFSLSIWDEPGLLVDGFELPPTIMMGHHRRYYERLVTAAGHDEIKTIYAYELPIDEGFPKPVDRIVGFAEKNDRIRIRSVDKSRFDEEAKLILEILNDAWSDNWGFVPLTDREVEHFAKQLKPIVYEDLIKICEVDGEAAAFMITLPDLNELTMDLNGSLFPFGWAKLLWRLRFPRVSRMRVPLMGVRKSLQGSRLATFMAFLMIEYIRRASVEKFGATRGEIGWILEDNGPMLSIADVIKSKITKTYKVYEKAL
ncbi:N-acetyltransferase [Pacificimonas flava]|uniref:N-acetyltransferase n=2 Tax=Pacificimonas TaxID=1960290 RepID=A0A219B156_9SPHN|nr:MULTISPECIES: N-acetyltransferase [Pacificimonas]MBZ6378325.1 N-acetyltransferase [Pacificimonas aurantium]OWV32067.1 N-acetyltransferase [Pacificimonas flava]